MPQINNIAQSMQASFGFEPMLVGGILAIILALVIIGGITRIAAFTSRIVPIMAIIYIIGALSVIFYNVDQIIPSFVAVFADAFTGSAATGGFLGATFAYAFNRGVNRGLFSNEAGQGSAPIAHAAAKAEEPVSEGIVSILEPFIDTIIICTLTGLVILASGAWNQKYENVFARSDIDIISGHYSDQNEADRQTLYHYVNDTQDNTILKYDGVIEVRDGRPINDGFTILHARSVAENVRFIVAGEDPYNGVLRVEQGQLKKQDITIVGESLLHSAALTVKAFSMGFLGQKGEYIVPISLMLFAFSTAIAWSYYGDRAVVYLFGQRGVMPYRILYVAGFFVASFTDTTLVWTLSYVAIVLMTLPNLFGIMLLRREMKDTVKAYWQDFNADKIKKD